MIYLFYQATVDEGAASQFGAQFRLKSLNFTKEFFYIVREHHLLHTTVFLTNWLLSTHGIPAGVMTDMSDYLVTTVLERLMTDFALGNDTISTRHKDIIVSMTANVRIWSLMVVFNACVPLFSTIALYH